jgi:aminoglycoside phosphotransferase (APT) family kinase protein
LSDVIVAPEVRDLESFSRQVAAWLAARIPGAEQMRIEAPAYPFGAGQSSETILFEASWREGGQDRRQGFALRIKPTRQTMFPDDLFDRQYRLMKVLSEQGRVRVATPYWFEEDPAVLGAPFFVMERRRGRVAVSVPPYAKSGWVTEATPAQRARMWESGVRQLAAIQSTPLDSVDFLAGPEGARSGLEQEWDKYRRFVAWVSQDRRWPPLEAALERLEKAWPKNQPAGVVWGDARLGNMMFGDDYEVVAVMDWEQPSLGGALHDLAWWLVLSKTMHSDDQGRPILEGFGTYDQTIALWREVTGLSADDIEWYEDFVDLKMSCLGIRMATLRGTPLPDEDWLARRLKLRSAA